MKRFPLLFSAILVGSLLFGVTTMFAQAKGKKSPVMMSAGDMKWETMKDAPPGLTYVPLWGDMTKGAHGVIVKFPPNMKNPLHTHSSDLKLVVISGTWTAGPEGGPEKSYGAGSYLMVPGGTRHTSGSGPDGCTFFQEGSGKFDMKPVEMLKK